MILEALHRGATFIAFFQVRQYLQDVPLFLLLFPYLLYCFWLIEAMDFGWQVVDLEVPSRASERRRLILPSLVRKVL